MRGGGIGGRRLAVGNKKYLGAYSRVDSKFNHLRNGVGLFNTNTQFSDTDSMIEGGGLLVTAKYYLRV